VKDVRKAVSKGAKPDFFCVDEVSVLQSKGVIDLPALKALWTKKLAERRL
jgi:hypothetical protein